MEQIVLFKCENSRDAENYWNAPIKTHPPFKPPCVNPRRLKIEEDGDFQKGKIKPKIRLKGYWLEQAGFKPGNHVSVKPIAHGVIELRSTTAAQAVDG